MLTEAFFGSLCHSRYGAKMLFGEQAVRHFVAIAVIRITRYSDAIKIRRASAGAHTGAMRACNITQRWQP